MCADNRYDKIKHLEFIQNAITRMAGNSFMCKGWAITLFAAMMAIDSAAPSHLSESLPLLAIVVLIAFWYLDSYYLRLERLFRLLYEDVRINDFSSEPYSMKFGKYLENVDSIVKIMFSISEKWVYVTLLFVVIIAGREEIRKSIGTFFSLFCK